MIYDVKVRPDIVIRVEADNEDQATQKAFAELEKTEGSKVYDKAFFDYDTGVKSTKLRSLLGIAEGRDQAGREIEKEGILTTYAGDEGFTYDSRGNLAITPEGQRTLSEKNLFDEKLFSDKNIVIDERGFSSGDFADFSGIAGPVFGAIAALSPHMRVAKFIKTLVGNQRLANIFLGGFGTAGGKGVEEAYESASGFQKQSKEEIAELLTSEFVFGAGAQTLGEIGGVGYTAFFGKKANPKDIASAHVMSKGYAMDDYLRLEEKKGRVLTTKEIDAEFKKGNIADLGERAAVSLSYLGAAIPGRSQAMGEAIAGRQARETGFKNYNQALVGKLRGDLADADGASKELQRLVDLDAPAAEIKIAKDKLKAAERKANNQLSKMIDDLSAQTGGFGPIMQATNRSDLGFNVQNTIRKAYKDTMNHHQKIYKAIDDDMRAFQGGIVHEEYVTRLGAKLDEVKKFIDDELADENVLLQYADDLGGLNIIKGLSEQIGKEGGPYSGVVNLTKLRKIEEAIKGVQAAQKLGNAGSAGHFFDQVKDKITKIIDEADETFIYSAEAVAGKFGPPPKVPLGEGLSAADRAKLGNKKEVASLVGRLREEQQLYREAIKPFNNARVQKIKTDNERHAINSKDVYEYVMKANRGGDMEDIINAMARRDPAVANQLRTDLTRRLFKDSLDSATDPATGIVNLQTYSNNILKYQATLEPLLGANYSKMVTTLQNMRKFDPKLQQRDVLRLVNEIRTSKDAQGTTFGKFLDSIEDRAEASNARLTAEKSRLMTNIENSNPETIVGAIFRPQSAREINQAKQILSPEAFAAVREEALEKMIYKGVRPGSSEISEIFKPGVFQRALDSYGDETLEAMFGKEMSTALRGLARSLQTTVGATEKAGAGTIVAGTIAANFFNLNVLPLAIGLTVYKSFFSSPKVIAALSKSDKGSILTVMSAASKALRIAGVTELREGTDAGIEAIKKEGERTGITDAATEQFKDVVDMLPTQAPSLDLRLPDVAYTSDQINTAPIGPTLLPNPRDQEIAELLRRV
tara:strand:+ start:2016 stop:5120 length:3105 start_codon:yes stop_codon:yes gene_type:complete